MKIVILDGYTLNPGDLDWSGLEKHGEVTVYERTDEADIPLRAADAEAVLTNKTPLRAATLAQLPKLRYIGVLATGYNVVDIDAARERRIPVTNVPTYGTEAVAQFVFALLLELCHRVQRHSDAVMAGEWASSADFCFVRSPLLGLDGRTLGLIGLGRIGRQTARIANAFGMRVIAVGSGRRTPEPEEGVEWVSRERLLAEADVISLHCPLTPETERMINAEFLARMKPTALLINTSRGGLVHEADLAQALNDGRIAGAGLDVLSQEPPRDGSPLIGARNCLITPHIAWAALEARKRLLDTAVGNVEAYVRGEPRHVVNG